MYARIRRFAPGKLISGYCCGIIVFAFHLSCLHICLHPSFSFRLTRLQIQLAISPPFSVLLLPFFLRRFVEKAKDAFCYPQCRISYDESDTLNCPIKLPYLFSVAVRQLSLILNARYYFTNMWYSLFLLSDITAVITVAK